MAARTEHASIVLMINDQICVRMPRDYYNFSCLGRPHPPWTSFSSVCQCVHTENMDCSPTTSVYLGGMMTIRLTNDHTTRQRPWVHHSGESQVGPSATPHTCRRTSSGRTHAALHTNSGGGGPARSHHPRLSQIIDPARQNRCQPRCARSAHRPAALRCTACERQLGRPRAAWPVAAICGGRRPHHPLARHEGSFCGRWQHR